MTSGSDAIQSKFEVDSTPIFPGLDPKRVAGAKEVLDHGTSKVYKSTRSGFSKSAVIAAITSRRKVLIVAPTNRILDETISDASQGNLVQVLPNRFCSRLEESIKQDPLLAKLPMPLPNCQECKFFRACPVTEILDSEKPAIAITYRRLENLILSKSKTAREIVAKLSNVNAIILDEAHVLALSNFVAIPAFSEVDISQGYPILSEIQQRWLKMNAEQNEKISQIADEGRKGHVGKHLSKIFNNKDPLTFRKTVAAFTELHDLAQKRKDLGISDLNILLLRDMIQLISSNWLNVTYVREDDNKEGKAYLTGNYWTARSALIKFLSEYAHRADHFYVSGTLIEPYPHFFSELSGKDVEDIVFPDLKHTNDRMTIYADKWRLSAQNFKKNLPRIIERVVGICKENPGEDAFVVAPNARIARRIQKCLLKVMGDAAPLVNYYRSDETMGVENSARICIAIGLAELPSNTYDPLAQGRTEDEKWIDSQRLRQESVDAASWQTWSRVKDPKGEEESRVYCIGIREDRIGSVISWGPGRRLELKEFRPYELPGGISGKFPIFKTIVSQPIKPPRIASEKATVASGRASGSIMECVKAVENYDPTLIISEFENILPIINNRQICRKLGIYNNPRDDFEIEATSAILTSLLATRNDYYVTQNPTPDKNERFGYSKQRFVHNRHRIIKYHVRGSQTVGFYQISLEDIVKWVCFDIDDHKGERGAKAVDAEVRKLLAVLSKYEIPFLLEASGSPNSYHVWILLKPTKTYNAYQFSRRIISEAGIECEVFPKQKSLNKESKYGNLVKVPLGINRRTGVRSQFLDPKTFEPYPGLVPIPGIVQLNEQIDAERETERAVAVQGDGRPTTIIAPMYVGEDLRPCMKGVLQSTTLLEGPEGHIMRVAIATEALNIGLTIDEAIEFFKDQFDYNRQITLDNVKYIYSQGYRPYSCRKLRYQCGSLVEPYCAACKWSNG